MRIPRLRKPDKKAFFKLGIDRCVIKLGGEGVRAECSNSHFRHNVVDHYDLKNSCRPRSYGQRPTWVAGSTLEEFMQNDQNSKSKYNFIPPVTSN